MKDITIHNYKAFVNYTPKTIGIYYIGKFAEIDGPKYTPLGFWIKNTKHGYNLTKTFISLNKAKNYIKKLQKRGKND